MSRERGVTYERPRNWSCKKHIQWKDFQHCVDFFVRFEKKVTCQTKSSNPLLLVSKNLLTIIFHQKKWRCLEILAGNVFYDKISGSFPVLFLICHNLVSIIFVRLKITVIFFKNISSNLVPLISKNLLTYSFYKQI